jgi:hypothetical protein
MGPATSLSPLDRFLLRQLLLQGDEFLQAVDVVLML